MKNKWCYDCYFKKQKPKGIFKKIYYAIWFLVNYPFYPSEMIIYNNKIGDFITEATEKGLKEQ